MSQCGNIYSMEKIIRFYSDLIKRNLNRPEVVRSLIRFGLEIAKLWVDHIGERDAIFYGEDYKVLQ